MHDPEIEAIGPIWIFFSEKIHGATKLRQREEKNNHFGSAKVVVFP